MSEGRKNKQGERFRALLLCIVAAVAAPGALAAKDLLLGQPVDCTLGRNCYIQQYFDRDPAEGAVADHGCGSLANDDHGGTDFAVITMQQVKAGVTVVAAAPGTVVGLRDGMPDVSSLSPAAPDLEGKDCGNGVVISHGGGWLTQYCHMRQGSVVVEKGQRVAMGTPLGLIGMSGRASFPHMHLTVRHNGEKVDPFDLTAGPSAACVQGDAAEKSIWLEPPAYIPGGLLSAGFAQEVPTIAQVRDGLNSPAVSSPKAPALVVWGYAFAGQTGDEIEIIFEGPEGEIGRHTDTLKKSQPFVLRAYGKRTPEAGWPWGVYRGTVIHRRGAQELGRRMVETEVN